MSKSLLFSFEKKVRNEKPKNGVTRKIKFINQKS